MLREESFTVTLYVSVYFFVKLRPFLVWPAQSWLGASRCLCTEFSSLGGFGGQ
jgi:hypothetical protein